MDLLHQKYPKTFHLPYSPGTTSDDKKLPTDDHLKGKEVVVSLKLDGESCSMTTDRIWARSVDSKDHPSRNWVKNLWSTIKHDIPNDMRICGENLFAKHSIYYTELPSYFICFNIWKNNVCLSWDETVEWCKLFEIPHVPVLYRGVYNPEKIISICKDPTPIYGGEREGIVGRLPGECTKDEFPNHFFKWVRKGHVQTSKHWMSEKIIPNIVIY